MNSDKRWFRLQEWVASQLKEIDPKARSTKQSGAGSEKGDVRNDADLNIECKSYSKKNVWEVDWLTKCEEEIPLHSKKTAIVVIENKVDKKVVCLDAEDFFDMYKNLWRYENEC